MPEHGVLPPNLDVPARDHHQPLRRCAFANEKRATLELDRSQQQRNSCLVLRSELREQVRTAQDVERSLGCGPVCQVDCDRSYDDYPPRPSFDSAAYAHEFGRVCRVLAYLGLPTPLESLLYATDASLARQAYSPRMMASFVNLAGFGFAAWDDATVHPEEPFVYRVTTLPTHDQNLRALAHKLVPGCVLAHVRGVVEGAPVVVSQQNTHPFRFDDAHVALAHNGHLREFARMRFDLQKHVRPELARRVEGNTDSEWLYVLVLSQLRDPLGKPSVEELATAVVRTLEIVRDLRGRHGITTASPVNLFVTTGVSLIVTRFSFDHGWYPPDDPLLELDLAYVTLWYTFGGEFKEHAGDWAMRGADVASSLLVASEPITSDTSTWLEVPEYSLLAASRGDGTVVSELHDLEV
jgi:glutamine amidotransferase